MTASYQKHKVTRRC